MTNNENEETELKELNSHVRFAPDPDEPLLHDEHDDVSSAPESESEENDDNDNENWLNINEEIVQTEEEKEKEVRCELKEMSFCFASIPRTNSKNK